MIREKNNDIELRHLPAGAIFKLCEILECGDGWKELMSVIPEESKMGNPLKYTNEHMRIIEAAGIRQKRPLTEILFEEWSTSGKCRPTLSILLQCLQKKELFRAADYVAVELLKGTPPPRPNVGPSAKVELELEELNESMLSPSAPPLAQCDMTRVMQVNYDELKSATRNFASSRMLGEGAWGTVYWAHLPQLGDVAVKRLHLVGAPENAVRQFCNEVQVLAQISHPNLLSLLGYSDDGPELCLAYQYMKHGSLLSQLACKTDNQLLSWRKRIEIALGAARGLEHLHTALPQPLVHRDVKSANILLDNSFTPKLGDFGLVRLGGRGNHTLSATVTTNIIGTMTYMAPEAQRGDVSVKMDVFSFGVVLLEIITGLPPLDNSRDGHDLVTHLEDIQESQRLSVADKKAGTWPEYIVNNLFDIAQQCLLRKHIRPSINEVIEKLDACVVSS